MTDQRVIDNLIKLNETLNEIRKEVKRLADLKEASTPL